MILDHYEEEKERFLNNCTQCGLCAKGRDDTFKRYAQWGELALILEDAEDRIAESPFARERILEVVQSVFVEGKTGKHRNQIPW